MNPACGGLVPPRISPVTERITGSKRRTGAVGRTAGALLALVLVGLAFRKVDFGGIRELIGGLGPRVLLIFVPSIFAIGLEVGAWTGAIHLLGAKGRYRDVFRVRVASESLAGVLPLGALWAETVKPALFARHCRFGTPTSVAAMAVRKYLLVASQAAYVAIGFGVGRSFLEDGFAHATGTHGLSVLSIAVALGLGVLASALAAALGGGATFRTCLRVLSRAPSARWRAWLAQSKESATRMDGDAARFFALPVRTRAPLLLACLGGWLLEGTETWLLLRLLGQPIHWGGAVGMESMVVLARHVFVFLPGGLGAQELGYAMFLGGGGHALSVCAAFVLLKRSKELAWALFGGTFLVSGAGRGGARSVRREFAPAIGAASALVLLGCAPGAAIHDTETARVVARMPAASPIVVLVALDGVRWQEIFDGVRADLADRYGLPEDRRVAASALVPNLHRIMTETGAAVGADSAAPMEASGPNFVSLPGYMEIFTGRTDSGCADNDCDRVSFPTIADDVFELGRESAVVASWPQIGRAAALDPERIVASVGRHGGVRRSPFEEDPRFAAVLRAGELADAAPGTDDFRPDAHTGELAVEYFAAREPGFLFVGLGEPDEYGHKNDYAGYLDALTRADAFVGRLASAIAAYEREGRSATLFVTTDHGRADTFASHGREHPESSRVWLAAFGSGIAARGFVASPRTRHLADIAPTIREISGLPRSSGPSSGEALTELLEPN